MFSMYCSKFGQKSEIGLRLLQNWIIQFVNIIYFKDGYNVVVVFIPPHQNIPLKKNTWFFTTKNKMCNIISPPPQLLEYMNFLFATLLGSIKR